MSEPSTEREIRARPRANGAGAPHSNAETNELPARRLPSGAPAVPAPPGSWFLAALALGLGIGLTSALFAIVRGSFYQDPPFRDAHRIVRIEQGSQTDSSGRTPASPASYLAWEAGQQSLEGIAAWHPAAFGVSGSGLIPERYNGAYVTPGIFPLLGIQPLLGRPLGPDDATTGAAPVVVVSHTLWQNLLGGDPEALGRGIRLHGEPRTIVGILPEGIRFPYNQDLWIPLTLPEAGQPALRLPLQVLGKVRKETTLEQVGAELQTLLSESAGFTPQERVFVTPFAEGYMDTKARRSFLLMLGATAAVLLIACANGCRHRICG